MCSDHVEIFAYAHLLKGMRTLQQQRQLPQSSYCDSPPLHHYHLGEETNDICHQTCCTICV